MNKGLKPHTNKDFACENFQASNVHVGFDPANDKDAGHIAYITRGEGGEVRALASAQYMEVQMLLLTGEGEAMTKFACSSERHKLAQWLSHILSALEYKGVRVDAYKVNSFLRSGKIYYLLVVSDAESHLPLFTKELSLIEYVAIKHNKLFD